MLVVDEETLNVRRIVIRTSVETRLNCAEVDASSGCGVTHVGAMIVVSVELPQVVDGVHVVVHDIEEHGESPLMAGVYECTQLVRSSIQHFRRIVIARIVGFSLGASILAVGQKLHGVEIHRADVVELGREIGEGGCVSVGVGNHGKAVVLTCERSHVSLIDDEVLKLRRAKRRLKLIDRWIDYNHREFRIGRGYLAGTWISA